MWRKGTVAASFFRYNLPAISLKGHNKLGITLAVLSSEHEASKKPEGSHLIALTSLCNGEVNNHLRILTQNTSMFRLNITH